MTVLWTADMETGTYSQFASTSVGGTGALTANAAAAFAGSFGSDASVGAVSGDFAYASSPAQTVTTSILSAQCRFKPHQMNVGAAGQCYLLMLHNSADSIGSQVIADNSGVYKLLITPRGGGTASVTLTTQFTLDTWYLLEFEADWSGANEIYRVYINGTLDTTYTDSSVGANIVYAKVLGGIYSASGPSGTVETYSDEYKLADALIGTGAAPAAVFRRSLGEFSTGAGRRQHVGVG